MTVQWSQVIGWAMHLRFLSRIQEPWDYFLMYPHEVQSNGHANLYAALEGSAGMKISRLWISANDFPRSLTSLEKVVNSKEMPPQNTLTINFGEL